MKCVLTLLTWIQWIKNYYCCLPKSINNSDKLIIHLDHKVYMWYISWAGQLHQGRGKAAPMSLLSSNQPHAYADTGCFPPLLGPFNHWGPAYYGLGRVLRLGLASHGTLMMRLLPASAAFLPGVWHSDSTIERQHIIVDLSIGRIGIVDLPGGWTQEYKQSTQVVGVTKFKIFKQPRMLTRSIQKL